VEWAFSFSRCRGREGAVAGASSGVGNGRAGCASTTSPRSIRVYTAIVSMRFRHVSSKSRTDSSVDRCSAIGMSARRVNGASLIIKSESVILRGRYPNGVDYKL
jgi:hypothetical protein